MAAEQVAAFPDAGTKGNSIVLMYTKIFSSVPCYYSVAYRMYDKSLSSRAACNVSMTIFQREFVVHSYPFVSADTPSTSAAAGGPSHTTATLAAGSSGSSRELTGRVDKAMIKEQLKAAEAYLSTTQDNRAEASSQLEDEARLFKESAFSPEQERRFRLIFHLVRFQVGAARKMHAVCAVQLVCVGVELFCLSTPISVYCVWI